MRILLLLTFILSLQACNSGPEPIVLSKDQCSACKMPIADLKFAGELITSKGRIYKFDDMHCLQGYIKSEKISGGKYFVSDANNVSNLIDAEKAFYVQSDEIKSPMGGKTIAYADRNAADVAARAYNTSVVLWNEVSK